MKTAFLFLFLTIITSASAVARIVDCEEVLNLRSLAQIASEEIFEKAGVKIRGVGEPDLTVNDSSFYSRVLSDPTLQLGETYMDGQWDSPAIDQLTFKLMTQMKKSRRQMLLPFWRRPDLAILATLKYGFRYFRDLTTNRQNRKRSLQVAENPTMREMNFTG